MDIPLSFRRELRTNTTDSETILWRHLRAHRFAGFKFRRQHPVGPYILDFYCRARLLAIEVDGGQHFTPEALEYDARRTSYLVACGITALRFQNDWVLSHLDAVLSVVADALGVGGRTL
ncbi:MAG TPA: endonuclease domain-containing protein [Polyangia bacterium]|jgi:very-short-patch-repair endonuclease|nr:endonuclease domain-containing protein [Polyangia bacterium]